MPTTLKRYTRGRATGSDGLTEADFVYFTAGDFFEAEGYADGKTEAELRAFWTTHREAIMGRYLAENRQNGHVADRPWSFWKWSAPEPRLPTPPREFDSLRVWDHQRSCFDWVETDFQYLKRLNLLERWELGGGK